MPIPNALAPNALGRGRARALAIAIAVAAALLATGCSSDEPAAPGNTGRLAITVSGLPAGAEANVEVSGPGNYVQPVPVTRTFAELAPGTYQVTATAVTIGSTTYQPTPANQSVAVVDGATASATIDYAP